MQQTYKIFLPPIFPPTTFFNINYKSEDPSIINGGSGKQSRSTILFCLQTHTSAVNLACHSQTTADNDAVCFIKKTQLLPIFIE